MTPKELAERVNQQPLIQAFFRAAEKADPEEAGRLRQANEAGLPDARMEPFLDALDQEYADPIDHLTSPPDGEMVEHSRSDLRYVDGLEAHRDEGGPVSDTNVSDLIAMVRWNANQHIASLSPTPNEGFAAEAMREALEFIADAPDPGASKERSATFYRVHAAMLKQAAAKALGRETVSQEAFDWAEEWANSEEGRAALTPSTAQEPEHGSDRADNGTGGV